MESSFQQIYQQLYAKLVRQAVFMLGERAAAEDVVQEAFLRLHNIGITAVNNPSAWLGRVTNNLCYNYMRGEGNRRRREEKVSSLPNYCDNNLVAPSAEDTVLDKVELQLIRQALQQLQPRDRMVLLMKFSGYKYHDIAAAVDINKTSVGTVLARARERFKQEYQRITNN
ncbi:sigma-70 family RNA polymerase sigma factor [Peptococcaceae bacterium 1198_IL3148]